MYRASWQFLEMGIVSKEELFVRSRSDSPWAVAVCSRRRMRGVARAVDRKMLPD